MPDQPDTPEPLSKDEAARVRHDLLVAAKMREIEEKAKKLSGKAAKYLTKPHKEQSSGE